MSGPLARLETMLTGGEVGFWQLHVPSGQLTRNEVFVRLTQMSVAELDRGISGWADRIHPADREAFLLKRQELLAGKFPAYWVDYRVRRTGGGWASLRARVAVTEYDAAGKPIWLGGVLTDISRERETERRMHALFDRPFHFIGLLTPDGVVVEANRVSLMDSGYTLEQVLDKPFWEGPLFAHSPALQARLRDGIARAARGESVRFEMSNPRSKEGVLHNVDFTLTPLRDDDGQIVNIIPESRDITDLIRTRVALRETEERLNTATDAANVGIWEWNLLTDRAWFSAQWYRLLGLPPNDLPTSLQTWSERVHADDQPRVLSALTNYRGDASLETRIEYRMRRADGTWGWFLSKARAVDSDERGRVLRVAGVSMDITDQHALEERLVLATHSGNIGLWDVQPLTGKVWVSEQLGTMLGYSVDELPTTDESFLGLLHPEDRERFFKALQTQRAGLIAEIDLEFRMQCKDGSWRWIHSKGRVVDRQPDGEAVRVTGVHIDITERKSAELRLAEAERLESIGRLAAGVAHEINTPVQYVNDSVYFIRDGVQELLQYLTDLQPHLAAIPVPAPDLGFLQEHLPSALNRAVDGLERVAEITRSMKEFSRVDHASMAQVDLNRAIQSTLTVASSEYRYVANVQTEFAPLPAVTCHGGQLNQVVLNLVVNAAHAIADVVAGTTDKGLITLKTSTDGDHVVIAISDTGKGIPSEIRHRIFEPFFTTKEVGRGTGQGLAIARNVVVQGHGGTLSFQTEAGKGTTFYVRLPISQPASQPLAASA